MWILGLTWLSLMLALPVQAQSVKFADLVGEWEMPEASDSTWERRLIFRADSTFTRANGLQLGGLRGGSFADVTGRWHLAGDTIVYSKSRAPLGNVWISTSDRKELVELTGQKLTLTTTEENGEPMAAGKPKVYQQKRGKSVTPTDLIGSWAEEGSKEYGYVFRADSTLRRTRCMRESKLLNGRVMDAGTWWLQGDTLMMTPKEHTVNGEPHGVAIWLPRRVTLQDGKLLVGSKVFERVDSLRVDPSVPCPTAPAP